MTKKHKHKFEWQEARIYGAKQPSGMMQFCMCGEIKTLVKDTGFFKVTAFQKREKFVPI